MAVRPRLASTLAAGLAVGGLDPTPATPMGRPATTVYVVGDVYRSEQAAAQAAASAAFAAQSIATVQAARDAAIAARDTATTQAGIATAQAGTAATQASAASTSASNASTSATNAAASATLANQWATQTATEVVVGQGYGAKKYANDASASAATAATSASNASTSASNASTSASNASTSAGTASTQAGNASTSATNAANSATAAATSAGNAATSATTATTQAGSAATSANSAATSLATLQSTSLSFQDIQETSVASAATVDLGVITTPRVVITGSTAITSFGTATKKYRLLRFAAALTITYNAASLILPGAANIVTAAGDTALAISDMSGNWRIVNYQRADGTALDAYSRAISDTRFSRNPGVAIIVAGSASAAIVAGDIGKLFTIAGASGTALTTRTLPVAADIFNGWSIEVKNTGLSLLRLSPLGGLTLDGSATLDILPGQEGRIIFDGASYMTRGIAKRVLVSKQTFPQQSNFNIVIPPGYRKYELHFDNWVQSIAGNGAYRFSVDGGATYLATPNYEESYIYLGTNAGPTSASRTIGNTQGIHVVAQGVSTVVGANGTIKIRPSDGTGIVNSVDVIGSSYDSSTDRLLTWQAANFFNNTSSRLTNILFYAFGGGNVSGTFELEGIV